MKHINLLTLITISILFPRYIQALDTDTEADFLAKEKERALSIVKYMQVKKEQDEAKEKKALEEEQQRKEKELLLQQERQKAQEREQAERQKQIEAREREQFNQTMIIQSELKARELKKQEIERQSKRVRYKIVRVFDTDRTDLDLNRDKYYVDNYTESGMEEIHPTDPVNRAHIVSNDVYVRLLVTTSISSRRAGSFVAMVEKNVYSSDSDNILIEKGSNFICNFEPLARYGETSVNATCTEINLTNGRKILINAPVYDQMGRIGMVGSLDNKTWEKYGHAGVMSLLSGLGSFMANKTSSTSDIKNLANYTALNMMSLSSEILGQTIDLAPVVTIPSGTRILVRIPTSINMN